MKVFFQHLKQTTSSNDIASTWLKQADPGSACVVTTEEQTGGRGQRGRTWDQQAALDLAWSMAIKWPVDGRGESKIPEPILFNKAIAVAIWTMVDSLIPAPGLTGIKWPNDILIRQDGNQIAWQKCAGMLIENVWKGERWDGTVIGVGININSDRSEETGRTSLRSETQTWSDISRFAVNLQKEVMRQMHSLEQDAGAIEAAYQRALIGTDQWHPYTLLNEKGWGKINAVGQDGELQMHWRVSDASSAKKNLCKPVESPSLGLAGLECLKLDFERRPRAQGLASGKRFFHRFCHAAKNGLQWFFCHHLHEGIQLGVAFHLQCARRFRTQLICFNPNVEHKANRRSFLRRIPHLTRWFST